MLLAGIIPCVAALFVIVTAYESRAVALRTAEIQNQCTILCNQLNNYQYLQDPSSEVINVSLYQLTNIYSGRVMVIDENLPLGLIANTAAIMGITLGKEMPEVVGRNVMDQDGYLHPGIIEFPVPILKADPAAIKDIREKLYEAEFQDLYVVDFSDLAQGCKTYDEFIEKMSVTSQETLLYYGIGICEPKKKVNKLTGSLSLLR